MNFLNWLYEYRESLKLKRLSKNMVEAFDNGLREPKEDKGPFVTYKFDMFENSEELKVFQNAQKLESSVIDFANWIRGQVKHGDDTPRTDVLSEAQNMFWECIDGNLEY